MKEPTWESLLSTLIELYADQMGVKIQYEFVDEEEEEKKNENMGENQSPVCRDCSSLR